MAKLNKMEISAIADKIYSDVKKSVEDYNKKIKSSSNYEKWKKSTKNIDLEDTLVALVDCISYIKVNYKNNVPYYMELIDDNYIEKFRKDVFEDSLKLKRVNIDSNTIERDIIIAQAKNEDLDKLIKELTEKYSA